MSKHAPPVGIAAVSKFVYIFFKLFAKLTKLIARPLESARNSDRKKWQIAVCDHTSIQVQIAFDVQSKRFIIILKKYYNTEKGYHTHIGLKTGYCGD